MTKQTTDPKKLADNREILRLSKLSEQGRLDYLSHRVLMHKYNISLQDYNRMFTDQEGKCAVCERHQTEFDRRLHVDHNHVTGQVRGLLCGNCNLAIGYMQENVDTMAKMAEYIERWSL